MQQPNRYIRLDNLAPVPAGAQILWGVSCRGDRLNRFMLHRTPGEGRVPYAVLSLSDRNAVRVVEEGTPAAAEPLKLEFREDAPAVSYGYYRCEECRQEWFGGGEHLHQPGCHSDRLTYVIGPKAVRKILECGERFSLNPFNASGLRAALPEVAARFDAEGGVEHA